MSGVAKPAVHGKRMDCTTGIGAWSHWRLIKFQAAFNSEDEAHMETVGRAGRSESSICKETFCRSAVRMRDEAIIIILTLSIFPIHS